VPFFLVWGGISFAQVMFLQAYFYFMIFVFEIPTGAVADFLGRRTSLIFASAVGIIAPLVYAYKPNFYLFILGETFWALGLTLTSGADEALIYDSLKKIGKEKESKKYFGRFNTFRVVAIMISAPIGGAIAKYMGLRYAMLFMAAPFFLGFLVSFTFTEPRIDVEKERRGYLDTLLRGVRYFRGHRIIRILTFDRITVSALVWFVIWVHQLLLKDLGVPIVYFGFVFALLTGVQIPFLHYLDRLEGVFKTRKRYLFLSAIIPGVCFIVLGFVRSLPVVIVMIAVISGIGLTRFVLFQNYTNKYVPSDSRATVVSTVSMLDRLLKAMLYPLIGLLCEWSIQFTLALVGVGIIICAIISRVEESHLIDHDA